MKTIVKMLVIVFVLGLTIETTAQLSYSIKAGVNFANMKFSDNSGLISNENFKMLPGFHIGATVDIPLSDLLSLETGLLFSTKGTHYEESESFLGNTITVDSRISTSYLDIPIYLKANISIGEPTLFFAFGPYVGFGLSGKTKVEMSFAGVTESDEENIVWGSDPTNDMLKRVDFGIVPAAGITLKSFSLAASYWWGLTNISSYTEDESCIKNQNFQISLAYIFGNNNAE